MKEIERSGLCDKIMATVRVKANNKIDKELKKMKTLRPLIPKLEDANLAGK